MDFADERLVDPSPAVSGRETDFKIASRLGLQGVQDPAPGLRCFDCSVPVSSGRSDESCRPAPVRLVFDLRMLKRDIIHTVAISKMTTEKINK